MSTTRWGRALPASTPPAPNRISFRSSVVETMVKTVAQCAIAVLSVTTSAPIWASGSAFDAVRFQTESLCPALTRRAAIASPMRPSPIQPMSCDALLIDETSSPLVRSSRRAAVWEGMISVSMSLRALVVSVLAIMLAPLLASCGGNLPNSAVSRHLAGRYAGALTDSTALATVIHDRGIRPPDLSSAEPVLDQLRAELAKSDPAGAYAGITYDLTRGNRLGSDWIVHTPNMWGRKSADLPASHSDAFARQVHDLVASARRRVDIAMLQPVPDGAFLEALRTALQELARRGPMTVRVILGQYPPDNVDVPAFFKALTEGVDTARLDLSVAAFRSCVAFEDCDSYSWNHAKIIAVDGRDALVGGHNMWAEDYLVDDPVSDLSMRVQGPAATSAARFIDRLWQYVCANTDKKDSIALATEQRPMPAADQAPGDCAGRDGVPILAVGRLGAGITKDFANQSELARDLMLGAARHEIRIVQQDLGFGLGRADVLFPDSTIDRLVDFLRQGRGDIYIVLSNLGAKGKSGSTYSNDVTLMQLARHLQREVQRRFEARDPLSRYEIRRGPDPVNAHAVRARASRALPLRAGPRAGRAAVPIANHAKFWMVDGRAFYIGSDNMYPVNLQEFGYIVDDPKAAQAICSTPTGSRSGNGRRTRGGVGPGRRELHLPRNHQVDRDSIRPRSWRVTGVRRQT